jgi:hypothetical protein
MQQLHQAAPLPAANQVHIGQRKSVRGAARSPSPRECVWRSTQLLPAVLLPGHYLFFARALEALARAFLPARALLLLLLLPAPLAPAR